MKVESHRFVANMHQIARSMRKGGERIEGNGKIGIKRKRRVRKKEDRQQISGAEEEG